jgi:DUF438 domain-containing protein
MSEIIDDSRREKQDALKGIVRDLHAGVPVEKLRKTFAGLIKNTSPEEIADMENALIQEGFPVEEVQRLCDVHAQVFDRALRKAGKPGRVPGHPIFSYREENKEAKKILKELKRAAKPLVKGRTEKADIDRFGSVFARFKEIEKHYARKENQLFPALETKSFTGPSKVMWGKHNEIRALIKKADAAFAAGNWDELTGELASLSGAVKKLIFLEEKILFPTAARKLNTVDWARIKKGEPEIGFAWITPSNLWDAQLAETMARAAAVTTAPSNPPNTLPAPKNATATTDSESIDLSRGRLTAQQVDLMLKSLPFDITFVDENDRVRYYSDTAERIFPRSPEIIGRAVQNCHPPKSVHIVNSIVQAFKDKTKASADFWIRRGGAFVLIRYFPVYDAAGTYKGVIEVSQEVSKIKALEGERRLFDA